MSKIRLAAVLLLAALAGCATRQLPAPLAETSPITGIFTTGVVAAVRPVTLTANDPTVTAVLAALGQSGAAPGVTAQEIVIRRDDGSVASVTTATQRNFIAGQTVDIITATQTIIRPD